MGSNRNYYRRGLSYLKRNGAKATLNKAVERIIRDRTESYYVPEHADEATLEAQRKHVFERPYRFSILVPVYETDPVLFRAMLDSVGQQTYGNWELILADASADESRRNIVRDFIEDHTGPGMDSFGRIRDRVKYVRVSENNGISANTNEALSHATGDYTGLLDHDDILENTALFDIMSAIESFEQSGRSSENITRVMAVYTDEDKVSEDGSRYFDLHVKPDFDPVLLCTNNYVCHFFVADTNLAKSVGGFRTEYDGAQDHDFILRCTEGVRREQILHVPKVLYHWRSTAGSTSENPDAKLYAYEAGRRAVEDHLRRIGVGAKITDSPHLGFFNIEYDRLHRAVKTITPEELAQTSGSGKLPSEEYILVLSPGLAPVDGDYIADMMSCMNLPFVGAVTGKIIGRDQRVESAGFDTDEDGVKVARFSGLFKSFSGYLHRADLDQIVEGFTEDCVLLRREAVESTAPHVTLKDGWDIYYEPKAVFKRKSK